MNIKDLNDLQKQAILDLAMLAMYADGHLAAAEDERIRRLLSSMGFNSESDLTAQYEASVARTSSHSQNPESARGYATVSAKNFPTRDQRLGVLDILNDIVIVDRHVSLKESSFLSLVHDALQI